MSNILYITMDQLSLHALSCYESYLSETPSIDKLAQDSVKFEKCYTACALCTPARASMLTGLYPHNHGALHNSGIMFPFSEEDIGRRLRKFTDILIKEGYNLGYQGKFHAGISNTANDLGFSGFGPRDYGNYKESERFRPYLEALGIEEVEEIIEFYAQTDDNWIDSSGFERGDIRATGSYFLTEETIRMIDEFTESDKPFFHWLSFWGPHAPYWPHESYLEMYRAEDVRRWESFEEDWENKPYIHQRFRESVMGPAAHADWDQWSTIISRYYAYTRQIDDQIGRLIDHLKDRGLYDDMTIIFTADHGDSLGIHNGVFDKGPMAFEQIYHIPMIIKLPNQKNQGTTHEGFISLLDLAPTISELAGSELTGTDGKSLVEILEEPSTQGRDDYMAEFHGHRFPVGQRIIWWDRYKYVLNFADRDELYDVIADPEELVNLMRDPQFQEIKRELRERMLKHLYDSKDNMHDQAYRMLTDPYEDQL